MNKIPSGVAHEVPPDLKRVVMSLKKVRSAWGGITPPARNEWICWIVSAKKPETRRRRIKRARVDLLEGKRRPCCWAGCNHR